MIIQSIYRSKHRCALSSLPRSPSAAGHPAPCPGCGRCGSPGWDAATGMRKGSWGWENHRKTIGKWWLIVINSG